jgi:hypothetical protein
MGATNFRLAHLATNSASAFYLPFVGGSFLVPHRMFVEHGQKRVEYMPYGDTASKIRFSARLTGATTEVMRGQRSDSKN